MLLFKSNVEHIDGELVEMVRPFVEGRRDGECTVYSVQCTNNDELRITNYELLSNSRGGHRPPAVGAGLLDRPPSKTHAKENTTLTTPHITFNLTTTPAKNLFTITIGKEQFLFDSPLIRTSDKIEYRKQLVRACKIALYKALSSHYNKKLPWGSLTGIRPTKLVYEFLKEGSTLTQASQKLQTEYFVSKEKAELVCDIVALQQVIVGAAVPSRPHCKSYNQSKACDLLGGRLKASAPTAINKNPPKEIQKNPSTNKSTILNSNQVNLYIHIPFCQTRCNYCSFVSVPLAKQKHLLTPYVEKLIEEIIAAKKLIKQNNLQIYSIYIGGGTPTVLDNTQLENILKAINADGSIEFTLEAGRPETIDGDNLKLMQKYGVNRISVNPQTLHNKTLQKIGRGHTREDFFTAYKKAKAFGFNINVDLIAGLDGETLDDFLETLEEIVKLEPHNITVHTLSSKRGAATQELRMDNGELRMSDNDECTNNDELRMTNDELLSDSRGGHRPPVVGAALCRPSCNLLGGRREVSALTATATATDMTNIAQKILTQNNYSPYYLYRQKNMQDNLENVGYTKQNSACVNNITVMEEFLSVIASGAGAISKRIYTPKNRIERLANPKDVKVYLERFDQILNKKQEFFANK